MRIRFGLGAWTNKHFEHTLYPLRTLHAEYLSRYAEVFDCAEADKLYHVPADPDELSAWRDQTPDGFTFLPKLHKSVVEARETPEGITVAQEWRDALEPLGPRLGPVLCQFPPSWRCTPDALQWLDDLLEAIDHVSVELRHPSWWTDDVRDLLTRHRAPLVWGTHPKAVAPDWATGEWGHVRFVGAHFKDARGRHTTQEDRTMDLLQMRERVQQADWQQCFVIVTNTFEGHAIDSLPRIAAALGDPALARRCSRPPGGVLFPNR